MKFFPARLALLFGASTCFSLACDAMTWSFPSITNSPAYIYPVVVAPQGADKVLAVGVTGATRLLNTATLTWSVRGQMNVPRTEFALTTLASDAVLATGGAVNNVATNIVERYDPTANTWASTTSMLSARRAHLTTRLASGNVLVIGGFDASGALIRTVELFDPTAGTWATRAPTLWNASSTGDQAFALADARVVLVHNTGVGVYNAVSDTWTNAAPPPTLANLPSPGRVAVQLNDGRIVVSTMGVYDPTSDAWTSIPSAPRQFSTGAAIPGNRAIFSGGELVPCAPSLFCQSNFAYEYLAQTNQWLDVGSQVGTSGPALTLPVGGGYFTGVNHDSANGYAQSGALYTRANVTLSFSNVFDLPLRPTVGQIYAVNVAYSGGGEVAGRAMQGSILVSDGSATCQIVPPATSCSLTTTAAGPKTLTANYPGDENYTPSASTYTPVPHVIVERNTPAAVSSSPSGIFDFQIIASTSASFVPGTPITLTASVPTTSTFTGWLGDCVGTQPCTFTMPADRHVRVKAFSAPNSFAPLNTDVDRSGSATSTTDALAIFRFLLNYPDAVSGNGALPATASPPGGSISSYLSSIRPLLDIDANGEADAMTDGLLILRYAAGFRGEALIANCVGPGARRTTASAIETHLQGLFP
jgi:hypothetical protein